MRTESNSFLGLKHINFTDDTQVNTSASSESLLQPPKGQIYKIVNMEFFSADPVGSTSGSQKMQIKFDDDNITALDDEILIAIGTGNTGTDLSMTYNEWGASSSIPGSDNEEKIFWGTRQLICSNSLPLSFWYINTTDANKTGTKYLNLIVEVYKDLL